jgi:hypothetical protein
MRFTHRGAFFALVLGAGCSGVDGSRTSSPSSGAAAGSATPVTPAETVSERDLDQDGKPELKEARSGQALVRRELDVNGDGQPDIVSTYGESGEVLRTTVDLNGDGRVDQTHFLEGGRLLRKELDTDGDGRADTVEEWRDGRAVEKRPL